MNRSEAYRIAFIAHGATGQMRANGSTPYIVHPARVEALVCNFSERFDPKPVNSAAMLDRQVAAWLHDVLEDTKLTADDLLSLGITRRQLEIVELMTKESEVGKTKDEIKTQDARYYQGIAGDDDAIVVKCADRCANLEDALAELTVPAEQLEVKRWANYIANTYTDVLPMYKSLPGLRSELVARLAAIETEIEVAKSRRSAYIRSLPCRKGKDLSHCGVHNSKWNPLRERCFEAWAQPRQ